MPCVYGFEPHNRLCVYRISGRVTVLDLIRCFQAARSDDRWSDRHDFLTLIDRARLDAVDAGEMERLMDMMRAGDRGLGGKQRRAAIVSNDPASQALLTFWEQSAAVRLLTEERLFRFENEARDWLASARVRPDSDCA